ncbi:Lrp/AsnC family transcriptional regulator [Maricaulaceae bacterium NA33B04]|nr:Lrp/AsnC family transcriptional regulator [Maricaulaceae bacterium NA33B04]
MALDPIDRAILRELQADGRLANAELAERVGLSASACHRRVRALEASGVIRGYAALLDPDAVERGLTVIVLATLENQRRDTLEAFEQAVADIAEAMECRLTTGAEDYILRLQVRDARDYERLHREQLSGLPGVARLISNIAMRTVFARTALPIEGA